MKSGSKILLLVSTILLLVVSMGACAPTAVNNAPVETVVATMKVETAATAAPAAAAPVELKEVKLINPTGPAVIPVAGINSGAVSGDIKVNVQYWKTVDEATGFLAGDDIPFAALPITTAANMAASGIDLVLLGVHEWKVFYLIAAEGNDFTDWHSLVGKTIYSPEAKGQTVDVLTRYALTKEGINPDKDVTFAYAPPQEIVALFKEGKISYAALPEPFVTLALSAGKGKMVLDYQDYWTSVSGAKNGIPVAGLFVKRDYLVQHPAETEAVVKLLSQSVAWSNENVKESIQASAKTLPFPEPVMVNALKRIKFEYVPAADAKEETLNFLSTMQQTYPAGIKKLPDDTFFK